MKKIIISLVLVFVSIVVFARVKDYYFSVSDYNHKKRIPVLRVVCIKGYLFAVMEARNNNGVAITQIYKKGNVYRNSPMTCEEIIIFR